jgi:hypothetical protein
MVKSQLTKKSVTKLCKIVTLEELKEGAECTTDEALREWENRMIEKYGLVVK